MFGRILTEIIKLFLEQSFSGDVSLRAQTGEGLGFYLTETVFKTSLNK